MLNDNLDIQKEILGSHVSKVNQGKNPPGRASMPMHQNYKNENQVPRAPSNQQQQQHNQYQQNSHNENYPRSEKAIYNNNNGNQGQRGSYGQSNVPDNRYNNNQYNNNNQQQPNYQGYNQNQAMGGPPRGQRNTQPEQRGSFDNQQNGFGQQRQNQKPTRAPQPKTEWNNEIYDPLTIIDDKPANDFGGNQYGNQREPEQFGGGNNGRGGNNLNQKQQQNSGAQNQNNARKDKGPTPYEKMSMGNNNNQNQIPQGQEQGGFGGGNSNINNTRRGDKRLSNQKDSPMGMYQDDNEPKMPSQNRNEMPGNNRNEMPGNNRNEMPGNNRNEMPGNNRNANNNMGNKGNNNMGGNKPPKNMEDRPLHDNFNDEIERAAQDDAQEDLVLCPDGCGRSFKEEALEKHVRICKKVFQSKRKKFDMSKQRVEDNEQKQLMKQGVKENTKLDTKANAKKAKWKAQSEQLRAQMQSNRGNGKLSAMEQKALDDAIKDNEPDMHQCKFCGRRFGEEQAKRHEPICKQRTDKAAMNKKPVPRGGAGVGRGRGRGGKY